METLPIQSPVLHAESPLPFALLAAGPSPHQALASYLSAFAATEASSTANYDPFVSPAFSALRLAPASLLLVALLLRIVPSWHHWAPRIVVRAFEVLSPFVTDDDLIEVDQQKWNAEAQRDSRRGPSYLLRRGAILDQDFDVAQYDDGIGFEKQRRRNAAISTIALVETTAWTSLAAYTFSQNLEQTSQTRFFFSLAFISTSWALTWLFVLLRFFVSPPMTPPLFVLLVTLLQLINAAVRLLEFLPLFVGSPGELPWASIVADTIDLIACLTVVQIILSMPVHAGGIHSQVPRRERQRLVTGEVVEETEDIKKDYELCPTTPEDYASLISTLTYTWMHPIQALSLKRPLLPADVWRLRSINDTRILSANFAKTAYIGNDETGADGRREKRSLRRRLLIANANDIALDFFYKICGVTLAYAGPALMNQILQCVTDAAAAEQRTGFWVLTADGFTRPVKDAAKLDTQVVWTPRQKAFVLALVSLVFTFIRYVAELKNFHHARQVGLRLRSILVVEMFEKALKRRNISGGSSDEGGKDGKRSVSTASSAQESDSREVDGDGEEEEEEHESAPLLGSNGKENGKAKKTDHIKDNRKREEEDKEKDESSRQADVGKVVNMMASDINRLLRLGCDSHQLYGAPLELVISTVFLYRLMGWSSIVGFLLMALATPMTYYLGKKLTKLQRAWKEATDRRISLVAELITAIRFVKLQGTEERWKERVLESRRVELHKLLAQRLSSLGLTVLFVAMPITCELVTFYIYVVVQGRAMTVPVAFTAITLFEMARTPLSTIPTFIMNILESIVSVRRLEAFLSEEEVEDAMSSLKARANNANQHRSTSEVGRAPLRVLNGHFSWINPAEVKANQKPFSLVDINLSFPTDGLSVIVGPTASGKSSMLAALLGEMKRDSGTVELERFSSTGDSLVSFAGQTPWLEAGKSIKANIIFVTPFDEERYNEVLDACALRDDLNELEDGDETRVSKETLSGGQKARLCLARALYHRSHTVLLDDVLAAVDTRVQRYLYQRALTGPLAQSRRVILVTHHLHLVLPSVDYLVILRQGHIEAAGTVEEVRSKGHDLETITSSFDDDSQEAKSKEDDSTKEKDDSKAKGEVKRDSEGKDKKARLLYDLEKRTEGNARFKSYWLYISVSNYWGWAFLMLLSVLVRVLKAGEPYWLKVWGEASQRTRQSVLGIVPDFPPAEGHEFFYLSVYASIGYIYVAIISVRFIFLYVICLKASKILYDRLLSRVLRARMRFFDSNPTGRILQRFNLDINILDSVLPSTIIYFIALLLAFLSQLIIVVVIVPGFLIPAGLGMALTIWGVQGYFRSTMYMQRIESTSTSPLYTAFTQILEGLTTVRAFGSESYFLDHMQTINAITSSQWWAICTIEVWLSFRAQVASGLSVFVATTLALSGAVSPGSAGMVISAASLLTTFAYNLTSMYKNLSNHTNSLERVAEYIDLDQEAPLKVEGAAIPAAWPTSTGGILVENLRLRYADDLPEVLHGVSFEVKPREKVAIVGRTGSGKTSLTAALLRAVEPSNKIGEINGDGEAKIVIDGIDVLRCGLEYRARLAVVPQDPVLFSGTVRENLDTFGEYSDDECRAALLQVQGSSLQTTSASSASSSPSPSTPMQVDVDGAPVSEVIPGQLLELGTVVAPGGTNFSAGQAQLLSLARALLKQSKVVILDEATSSTDFETDARIQEAIRGLKDSIILTVAHRLGSVIDYDRILVLSNGNIVEFDTPANLLRNSEGHFNMLCRQAGQTTYHQLCTAAGVEPI